MLGNGQEMPGFGQEMSEIVVHGPSWSGNVQKVSGNVQEMVQNGQEMVRASQQTFRKCQEMI